MDKPRYKLFRLVGTFSDEEWAGAEKYLSALNREAACLKLFKKMKKLPPETLAGPDAKAILFRSVFPGQAYNDARLRKLMAHLTRHLEGYLIQSELEQDEPTRQHLLIRSLQRRSDYKLFKEAVGQRLKTLEGQPLRSTAYFQERHQLLKDLYYHPETAKRSMGEDVFGQYLLAGERHILLASLLDAGEQLVREKTTVSRARFPMLDAALSIAARQDDGQPAAQALFSQVLTLLLSPGEEADLPGLKAGLQNVFPELGETEQRMALKLLIHYALPFSNNGSQAHSRFMFDLYQLGIHCGLLQQGDNAIETNLFVNISTVGILVGELDWVARFMEQYGPLLPAEDRESAYHICWANWHYHVGLSGGGRNSLDEAIKHLLRVPTRSEDKFDLRARSLLLRVHFDAFQMDVREESLDDVLAQAKNFEQYLRRHATYPTPKKESYLRFIGHCRQLARLVNQPGTTTTEYRLFLEALLSDSHCALRRWLEEKAGALLHAPTEKPLTFNTQ
ncbi:MAG: hypothetical protein R2830_25135 [Saprospiraceae bacterium]